jgi:flagellar basal body-associated protein FliL
MKNLLRPKIIIPVSIVLLLFIVGGVVGYIMFAPATWWKPFYIRMEMDGQASEAQAAEMSQTSMPAQQPMGGTAPTQSGMPAGAPGTGYAPPGYNLQQQPGIMYRLDNKVVNLAEPGGLRYLQASIVLELWPLSEEFYMLEGEERTAAEEEFQELIDARRPIIDDIITTLLSSKTYNDVATVEGKQLLKEELMTAINDALGYQGVTNVYFTSFVVQ